jgi:hypothetical protein
VCSKTGIPLPPQGGDGRQVRNDNTLSSNAFSGRTTPPVNKNSSTAGSVACDSAEEGTTSGLGLFSRSLVGLDREALSKRSAPPGRIGSGGSNDSFSGSGDSFRYLFHATRPTLTLQSQSATFGGTVSATAIGGVHEISLKRLSACTHSCDNEQRLVDVTFTSGAGISARLRKS